MSDEIRPPEPKTVEIPSPGPLEIILHELRRDMKTGFATVNANVDTLIEDGKAANKRMSVFEVRLDALEGRMSRNSDRAKNIDDRTSQADLSHEAAIAAEVLHRQEMEKRLAVIEAKTDAQTVMLEKLVKVAGHPLVQKIATALGTAILTWLAMKGIK